MWALGVIMFYLITKKHPFDRDGKDQSTILAIADPKEKPNKLPKTVSLSIQGIIYKLLDKDPNVRPDAADVLNDKEI
jgi:serine/threonine protein kinase